MKKLLISCAIFISVFATLAALADEDQGIQLQIFNTYLEQAKAGDSTSQFIVASRYESGKGTERSPERALFWYREAAKNGHPLALRRLENQEAEDNPKPVNTAAAEQPKKAIPAPVKGKASKPNSQPKAMENARTVVAEKKQPPVATVAAANHQPETGANTKLAASTENPSPAITNILQSVLAGKWSRDQGFAEILPSPVAACLQNGPNEVVCFSEDLTRNIDNRGLTYSVKSTLSNFNNREARFNLHYIYNVVDMNNKPFAKPSSTFAGGGDLAVRNGWQEPGIRMECRMSDERAMLCTRNDRKANYQFTRD